MYAVYLAWKHGGHDPFRFYNRLGEDSYPLRADELDRWLDGPVRPRDAHRLRNVLYAFALQARHEEMEAAAVSGGISLEEPGSTA